MQNNELYSNFADFTNDMKVDDDFHPIQEIINFIPNGKVGIVGCIYDPETSELESLRMALDRVFHKLTNHIITISIYKDSTFYIFIIPKYRGYWVKKMLDIKTNLYSILNIYSGQKYVKLSNDYNLPVPCDLVYTILKTLNSNNSVNLAGFYNKEDDNLVNFIKSLDGKPNVYLGQEHSSNATYGMIMKHPPKKIN